MVGSGKQTQVLSKRRPSTWVQAQITAILNTLLSLLFIMEKMKLDQEPPVPFESAAFPGRLTVVYLHITVDLLSQKDIKQNEHREQVHGLKPRGYQMQPPGLLSQTRGKASLQRKLIRNASPGFLLGTGHIQPSLHAPEFYTSRRKTGAWHRPCVLND